MIEEMTEAEIEDFLAQEIIGRVGCHLGGVTYVVPVIFAWDARCAYVYTIEGQKIQMMRENPKICFEVDRYLPGGSWRSVIIQGDYEELTGEQAARTLELLASRFASRQPGAAGPGSAARPDGQPRGGGRAPVAFRVRAAQITGRRVDRPVPPGAGSLPDPLVTRAGFPD